LIDAKLIGNNLRYVNHSKKNKNCFTKIIFAEGIHKILFFAERDIKKYEELFFDYDGWGTMKEKYTWINDDINDKIIPPSSNKIAKSLLIENSFYNNGFDYYSNGHKNNIDKDKDKDKKDNKFGLFFYKKSAQRPNPIEHGKSIKSSSIQSSVNPGNIDYNSSYLSNFSNLPDLNGKCRKSTNLASQYRDI